MCLDLSPFAAAKNMLFYLCNFCFVCLLIVHRRWRFCSTSSHTIEFRNTRRARCSHLCFWSHGSFIPRCTWTALHSTRYDVRFMFRNLSRALWWGETWTTNCVQSIVLFYDRHRDCFNSCGFNNDLVMIMIYVCLYNTKILSALEWSWDYILYYFPRPKVEENSNRLMITEGK